MTATSLTNPLLIIGLIFLTIAVIGRAKLGFAEINPGCFGRTLALIAAVVSLTAAFGGGFLPVETWESLRTSLPRFVEGIPQFLERNINAISQFLPQVD